MFPEEAGAGYELQRELFDRPVRTDMHMVTAVGHERMQIRPDRPTSIREQGPHAMHDVDGTMRSREHGAAPAKVDTREATRPSLDGDDLVSERVESQLHKWFSRPDDIESRL